MTTDCEFIVIGAGVVGLAIAARLSRAGRDVLILEKEAGFGTVTSARNSEVIHAGIYYPANSLKARLCVDGKQRLYAYCRERAIAHRQCGKLIVATTEAQANELIAIRGRAEANGVCDIRVLTGSDAQAMEPQLQCVAALCSPSTGIVDSHALMVSLLGDAQNDGAMLATRAPVTQVAALHTAGGKPSSDGYRVSVGGNDPMDLTTRWVINAAGHGACAIADSIASLAAQYRPEPLLSKGNYFRLAGKAPFSRLVYPVPEPGGLGVHITIDLGGRARFGPDVEPVDSEEYSVDAQRSSAFYAAVRRYWPNLQDGALQPDYSGIRPKIRWQNELYPDFLVQSPSDHGMPGLVNLFGIESPGLTSSLALARHVEQLCRSA